MPPWENNTKQVERKKLFYKLAIFSFLSLLIIGGANIYSPPLSSFLASTFLLFLFGLLIVFLIKKLRKSNASNIKSGSGNPGPSSKTIDSITDTQQSFYKALLSFPHGTFREKYALALYIAGILFFSIIHPFTVLIVVYIGVLHITQGMFNILAYFFLPFISVPIYLFLLNRSFRHWTKSTILPPQNFLNTVFLSQIIYLVFYLFCYLFFTKILFELNINSYVFGFLFVPFLISAFLATLLLIMWFSKFMFLSITKAQPKYTGHLSNLD